MITTDSLTIEYKPAGQCTQKKILDNVSIAVKKGKITAIVGESGCGKTLFTKSILGILPDDITVKNGTICLSQNSTLNTSILDVSVEVRDRIIKRHIGLITQNPIEALNPSMRISKQLEESLFYSPQNKTAHSKTELTRLVREALIKVGIVDINTVLNGYPHELSGGMCQRVMIAMMMLKKPDLLIADEPTTALDMVNQAEIIKELLKLKKEMAMTILLITHDLSLVMEVADYIYVLKEGKVIEQGNVKEIYDAPKNPYTQMFLQYMQSQPLQVDDIPLNPERKNCLEVTNLYKYYGKKNILTDISFYIKDLETVSIIGESGSGKSTLAKVISGIEDSNSGKQIYFNTTSRCKKMFKIQPSYRQNVQIVFQNSFLAVNPKYSIFQILAEPLKNFFTLDNDQIKKRITQVMVSVELDHIDTSMKSRQLSGGQLQRVCLARALLAKPKLLILDEFTSSLDMIIRHKILELVQNLQRKYKFSIIFITHDLDSVLRLSDRFYVMKDGTIVDEVIKKDNNVFNHPYTKILFESVMSGNPHQKNIAL